jgi:hypothetical protein
MLFSYLADGGDTLDLVRLPAYVSRVECKKHMARLLASGSGDPRAPSAGPEDGFPRSAGAIFTQDPLATLQTMTVDIHLERDMEFEVALYFLDWDMKGRRTGIELFDLDSRELIAPVRIVHDQGKGRYMVYRTNRSVRFRINHVRGPNASLSALFFDSPNE